MEKKFKLGVLGAGFMATSIIKGAIDSKSVSANEIIVSDLKKEALDKISLLGVSVTQDNFYLADNAEFVLFAVKPQSLDDVLQSIKGASCEKIITIMAGVKKERIRNVFSSAKICRCMPNTPCSIGCGAIGADVSEFLGSDAEFVGKVFSSLAQIAYLPEKDLNAVTGISGSSPAYFYLFLSGIIKAGVKNGLSEENAKLLAVNTMIGSGQMVLNNSDKTIDELISAVCSKGGTTIEAVKVFNECGLDKITEKAVDACVKRASELENI